MNHNQKLDVSLRKSISETHVGELTEFESPHQLMWALLELWPVEVDQTLTAEVVRKDKEPLFSRRASTPTSSSSWAIAFTPTFQKSIASIDRKPQGRILIAIADLSEEPITVVGDTKKPLSGELKGFWRYRLGDYRLIYEPNEDLQKVVLLEFSARGGSYE